MKFSIKITCVHIIMLFILSAGCLHERDNVNDPGAENNYVDGVPVINVTHDSEDIADSGVFDIGDVAVNESIDVTFSIENTGDAYLDISRMQVTSSIQFSVTASPVTPVKPGGSTSFTIRFTPDDEAEYTLNVYIYYFDTEDRMFIFTLRGAGIY